MGKKYTHLSLDDRIRIEKSLDNGEKLCEIGRLLGKDPSSISKEIKRHRIEKAARWNFSSNNCSHKRTCNQRSFCHWASTCRRKNCVGCCRCKDQCEKFIPESCQKLEKGTLVCNGCHKKSQCRMKKYYYRAVSAQKSYFATLKTTREGINIAEAELAEVNRLISPLIKTNGQSIAHIFSSHQDQIPFSSRTLYSYIDQGLLPVKNIDLIRKVRYKPRKKHKRPQLNKERLEGRRHDDFLRHIEQNPDYSVVEMDTVEGRKGGKVILTFHFRKTKCLLAFLLKRKTQECVKAIFDNLEAKMGTKKFKQLFQVVLTDNGSEFNNPSLLEKGIKGKRTAVFYCNPYASYQKGALEKNHEFIRRIIPKGRSMDSLSQELILKMVNNINSVARDSLNGQTPFKMASLLIDRRIISLLELQEVEADKVMLKPALLK